MLTLEHRGRKFESVTFSPDADFLAARSTSEVVLWQLGSGSRPSLVMPLDGPKQFGFVSADQLVVRDVGSAYHVIYPRESRIHSLQIVPRRRRGVRLGLTRGSSHHREEVRSHFILMLDQERFVESTFDGLWLGRSLKPNDTLRQHWRCDAPSTYRPAIAPHQSWFAATLFQDHGFRLARYDLKTGDEIDSHPLSQSLPHLVIAPSGHQFASIYFDSIRWCDIAQGKGGVIRNPSGRAYSAIEFHPTGRFAAATSDDQTVQLVDTSDWELVRSLTWEIGRLRCLAFSRDGTLAAVGSDTGQVMVWDVDA